MDYITPLTIGLIGSFHCVGMCGPIAVALPLKNRDWLTRILSTIIYNSGRIITYGILGFVFGLLGRGIHLAGLQQGASIAVGAVMIFSVIFPFFFGKKLKFESYFSGFAWRLTGKFKKLFSNRSYTSLLAIGLMNGLLPCGLVYVAVAGALNTNNMISGFLFMVLFGIGTTGLLIAVSLLGNIISTGLRNRIRKFVPWFIALLGILFILRGLSLGIPYISPNSDKLEPHEKIEGKNCCK